jgi:rSAM/selenodomain-associated transferase 2
MEVSFIIPTLNEAKYCRRLFHDLQKLVINSEVIVVDGGSADATQDVVREFGFELLITEAGRSRQLAAGANKASGEYLLFLHADVRLDGSHQADLSHALEHGVKLASFPIIFDKEHWFLKFNTYFSRFSHPYFHFGDQGLWISRRVYDQVGGFDPNTEILEDQDIYRKASKICKPIKFNSRLIVSARKYREYGVIQLQFLFYKLWLMSKVGYSREKIASTYRNFLSTKKRGDT